MAKTFHSELFEPLTLKNRLAYDYRPKSVFIRRRRRLKWGGFDRMRERYVSWANALRLKNTFRKIEVSNAKRHKQYKKLDTLPASFRKAYEEGLDAASTDN